MSARWSDRQSLLFIVAISATFWLAIVLLVAWSCA